MGDVKVVGVGSDNENGNGFKRSSAVRASWKKPQVSIISMGMMYGVPFQSLLDVEEKSDEYIRKFLWAFISDQLWNTHWTVELSKSEGGLGKSATYYPLADYLSTLLDPSARGHEFCTAFQFNTWYELLAEKGEEVWEQERAFFSEEPATQTSIVFEFEERAVQYV